MATKSEEDGLRAIRARMSESQRKEMSEIIAQEMNRRGLSMDGVEQTKKSKVNNSAISGSLSKEQVGELYNDVGRTIQQMRVKKLEQKLASAKAERDRQLANGILPKPHKLAFSINKAKVLNNCAYYAIAGLVVLKLLVAGGTFDSNVSLSIEPDSAQASIATGQVKNFQPDKKLTPIQNDVLMQLDARRVELEDRASMLDKREEDLNIKGAIVKERLVELRALTQKIMEVKNAKDKKYDSRLEQLANVYSAMEPNEAATLIAKLDDTISLALLERMPEKRMGQILSFMEKGRAVELTKIMTERR